MSEKKKWMKPPFVKIHQGKDRQWYWSRHASNNKVVGDGGEAYSTKSNCKKAALKEAKAHGIPVVFGTS